MANGEIKTRFVLEGEQKFRSAMKEAANSMKVLNSEQKLAKAAFKQSGDGQKYAAQQADILRRKIEEQKKAVKAAEDAIKQLTDNGVKENDRSMQQWQTKLNNAKTALTNMETELNTLTATSQETAQSTDQLGDSLQSLNTKVSLEQVIGGINRIADGIGSAITRAKDLAVSLVGEMRNAASWADDLLTTAMMWQMDPQQLQRMYMVADTIDTPVEAIVKAQKRLKKTISDDSKETREMFRELGMYTDKYAYGVFNDSIDLFWQAGDAIMRLGNEFKQEEYAQKIFGRSWEELIPLFKAGREAYESALAEQQTVSDENLDKLGQLDDAFQDLSNKFETFKNTILAEISHTLTELTTQLTGFLSELNNYLASEDGKAALQGLSDSIHSLFEDLTNIKTEDVFAGLQTGIDTVKKALEWIKTNSSEVVDACKKIVAVWAGLKVSAGILTLLQVIKGLKDLAMIPISTFRNIASALGGKGAGSGTGTSTGTGASPVPSGGGSASKGADGAATNPGWFTRIISKAAEADLAFKSLPVVIGAAITTALAGYTSSQAVERDYGGYNEIREAMTGTAADVATFGQTVVDAQKAIEASRQVDAEEDTTAPLRQFIADNEEAVRAAGDALNVWARVDEAAKTKGVEARQVIEQNMLQIPADQWLQTVTDFVDQMGHKGEEAKDEGSKIPESVSQAIEEGTPEVEAAAESMMESANAAIEGTEGAAEAAGAVPGAAAGQGFANALEGKVGAVEGAARRLAGAAQKAMQAVLQVHSPSRVMYHIGEFVGEGLAQGIDSQVSTVTRAAERMASAAMVQPGAGSFGYGSSGRGMVDVTLMLGPERLTEVLVPLVNDGLGAALALERR